MTTRYTIPNRPEGGATRSIESILANFDEILTGMNAFDGSNIRARTITAESMEDRLAAIQGVSSNTLLRRGKTFIAREESIASAAFESLATADTVRELVLPTEGLIVALYHATWRNTIAGGGGAQLFLNNNAVRGYVPITGGSMRSLRARGPARASEWAVVCTCQGGLMSVQSRTFPKIADLTTGQSIGAINSDESGGISYGIDEVSTVSSEGQFWAGACPVYIFANAGTYEVRVKYNIGTGVTTARERKLWAWTMGF